MRSSTLKQNSSFFLFISLFFIFTLPAFAEPTSLYSYVEDLKKGEVSAESFSGFLISSVKNDPEALSSFTEYRNALSPEVLVAVADASTVTLLNSIKNAIADGQTDQVIRLQELSELLLPKDWIQERERVNGLVSAFTSFEKIKETRDLDTLLKIDFSKLDKQEKELFESKALKLVKQFVEQAYDSPNRFDGFKVLSKIDSMWPLAGASQRANDLLVLMAEDSKLDLNQWSFDEPQSQSLVQELISADESNRKLFLELYEQRVIESVKSKSFNKARVYLNWITGNRLDPNPENIALRKKLIGLGVEDSFIDSQVEFLEKNNLLNFSEKVSYGHYGNSLVGIILAILCFAFIVIAAVILKPKLGSLFNRKPSYSKTVEADDEYTRLLSIFGLDENASETQIKRAFRSAVKEHHPDAHGAGGVVTDADGNQDETFQQLKQSYDRILEIRSSWFGSS